MIYTKNRVTAEKTDSGLDLVKVESVSLFDVGKIFDCGQCFRFDIVEDSPHAVEFAGCAMGKYVSFGQDGDTLYIYNSTLEDYENIWEKFLGLEEDYGAINESILSLSENQALSDAVRLSSGIRILKQEPWEAICSFIISQNNNIPRIKKLVAALCKACGDKIDISNMKEHIATAHQAIDGNFYSFPTPDRVLELGVDGLAALKTGFRAKYIHDAAQRLEGGELDLDLLLSSSTEDATKHLCTVKGIGPKVASCALLFGFSKLDAFPVDVWIKKVIEKYFDKDFAPSDLGKFAGIAQQYLFYYERYLQS
jgi:N-glycosylase/DNA lyase